MHIRLLINYERSEESQSNQKIKRIFFLTMRNISKVNDHHQLKKIPILNDCMFHIHFTLPHPSGINNLVNDDRLTDLQVLRESKEFQTRIYPSISRFSISILIILNRNVAPNIL